MSSSTLSPAYLPHEPTPINPTPTVNHSAPTTEAVTQGLAPSFPHVLPADTNGVQRIRFKYGNDEFTIRGDVDSIDQELLKPDFKTMYCLYSKAKDGNRVQYETECNKLGWALVELNPDLANPKKRGLLQTAVVVWRNTSKNKELHSRRARKIAKRMERGLQTANQVAMDQFLELNTILQHSNVVADFMVKNKVPPGIALQFVSNIKKFLREEKKS